MIHIHFHNAHGPTGSTRPRSSVGSLALAGIAQARTQAKRGGVVSVYLLDEPGIEPVNASILAHVGPRRGSRSATSRCRRADGVICELFVNVERDRSATRRAGWTAGQGARALLAHASTPDRRGRRNPAERAR
jgi:hypothetical protein